MLKEQKNALSFILKAPNHLKPFDPSILSQGTVVPWKLFPVAWESSPPIWDRKTKGWSRNISPIWKTHEWQNWYLVPKLIGEGNGTPLQYSCLENPRDGGAWWAAVSGVAQSWTRLKWLSSSRSSSSSPKLIRALPGCRAASLSNFQHFIYFWLCWVFVAVHGLSLVAVSRGYSSLWCEGISCCRAWALGCWVQ